ncbi:hypothetical protein DL764_005464 [Monosporascus ibericus]|uniref:Transcription factor RfeG n=1 Tax=Monosporascus ibericus TaxID=155417 RepID=A0A4Q4T958_9PEZI|nr:hypothetical protein DL764_005464 [Monosporascus ibericus]
MSRRPGASSNPLPAQGRQNEYFVPRDGIDREVITADICRYLGNDALVRPGTYENPQTGQLIQGYYINAYRNLTTAMIDDLKADSARWEQERRQQSARSSAAGGIIASSASNAPYSRASNSPTVQYRNSETHSSRQYYGPTEGQPGYPPDNQGYADAPRYPGTGSQGYNGAANSSYYPQQQAPQGTFASQPGFSNQAPQQYAPQPGSVVYPPSQDPPYHPGADYVNVRPNPADQYAPGDQFVNPRDPRDMRDPRGVPVTTMAPSRTAYATSGPPPPSSGYATSGAGSYYTQQAPQSGTSQFPIQPTDAFFGRAGTVPYSQESQYEASTPAPSRTPTSTSNAQMPPSGSSSSRTHRERDSVDRAERHSDSRHGHRHRSGR